MFVLVRTIVFASLFIAFFLVFLPARVLSRAGIEAPGAIGIWQVAGAVITLVGSALALACVFTFSSVGRGTPAPFDPPRRLVDRGPYGWIRNPMYVGATIALLGAAAFYRSWQLALYAIAFWSVTALFVFVYEEPTLLRTFGQDYEAYCARVGRWWPKRRRSR